MRYVVIASIILSVALLGWWLWRTAPEREEEKEVSGPKIVIEKGEIIGMYKGRKSFILRADNLNTKTEDIAVIDGNIKGAIFDEDGEMIVSFEGLGGEVDLRNSNFKIYSKGRIKGKDLEVLADSIDWDNTSSVFRADGNIEVRLNSYKVRCRSIRADFLAQVIELSGKPVLEF